MFHHLSGHPNDHPKKDGDPVRKSFLLILILLLTAFCACAVAATEYPLDTISGKMLFNEDLYVVLTPRNLSEHPDLLSSMGKTAEELQADWAERGVVLQAWGKGNKKTVVEVIIIKDDSSARYYDTNEHTNAERVEYKNEIVQKLKSRGYTVFEPHPKKRTKVGYFIELEYLHNGDGGSYRGIYATIVRNGYTFSVDYQAYDRSVSKTDRDRCTRILNDITIDKAAVPADAVTGQESPESAGTADVPAGAGNTLVVTTNPPAKTNDGIFTVEGNAYPGSEIIVVAMRWAGSSSRFQATAGKNGKFSVKVTLPNEGLYQITVNMCYNDVTLADAVLNTVTYSTTLLPYTLNAEIPKELSTDKLVISGTTVKNVEIQCIVTVDGGSPLQIKPRDTVKTNGSGNFSFTVPTEQEGEYEIVLSFAKKGLNSERETWKATRKLSVADQNSRTAGKAEKVNYNQLVKKLDSYVGHTISFDVYITEVKEVGDQWMIVAAQKLNRGKYSNYLVYMADEDPGLTAGVKVKLYGVCTGPHSILSEEENLSYPGFDYLFFD